MKWKNIRKLKLKYREKGEIIIIKWEDIKIGGYNATTLIINRFYNNINLIEN